MRDKYVLMWLIGSGMAVNAGVAGIALGEGLYRSYRWATTVPVVTVHGFDHRVTHYPSAGPEPSA